MTGPIDTEGDSEDSGDAGDDDSRSAGDRATDDAIGQLSFVLTLTILTALSAITVDISLPSLPTIAESFERRPEAGGILISAYLFGYGPGQLLWGPLADRFGRMPPLIVGLIGFIAVTVACVFATSIESLTALRAAQGVFGGSGPVIARAIARDQGGGERTAKLLATIAMIFGAAPMLAPMIGSGILLVTDWSGQFWFLAGLALALIVAARAFIAPVARGPRAGDAPRHGYFSTLIKLFRARDFAVGCAALTTSFFGYATLISVGAAMTENRYGIAPAEFGPLFAIPASSVILGPWLGRRLLRTHSIYFALRTGALICASASVALFFMAPVHVPLPVLWCAVFVYVFGFGMVIPLANALALEPAGEYAGMASSWLGAMPTLAAGGGAAFAASAAFASAYQGICFTMAGSGVCCCLIVLLGMRTQS